MSRIARYVLVLKLDNARETVLRYAEKQEAINAWNLVANKYSDMSPRLIDVWECFEYVGNNKWLEEEKHEYIERHS